MLAASSRSWGRTVLETTIAIIVLGIILAILVPTLRAAIERAWDAECRGHLQELFRAMQIYLHPDRGGNWLPASEVEGPYWFEKIEPLVAGHEQGQSFTRFSCPKAPLEQRPEAGRFTRGTVSFGWNEGEFPWGSVYNQVMKPREKMILADSLGSAGGPSGPKADTVVTRDGQFRLDARHEGTANVLFLDGHVDAMSRRDAGERWPQLALAPPRPGGAGQVQALRPWHWLAIFGGVAVPYGLVVGVLIPHLRGRAAARAEKERRKREREERQAEAREEEAWEAARREYLRNVPSGPVEPVPLPKAAVHVGERRFRVQPDRELTIGRGERARLRIRSSTVSRQHAKIRPEPRGYVLYDLYSRTGTFFGGKKIERKVLADGDRIRVGPEVEIVFRLEPGKPRG